MYGKHEYYMGILYKKYFSIEIYIVLIYGVINDI